jgi:DNA-binding CsgD family transcriptional regulator
VPIAIQVDLWRGSHALFCGDLVLARRHFADSILAAHEAGDDPVSLFSRFQLTIALALSGDDDPGGPASAALPICARIDESWMRSHALWSLSVAALLDERLDEARALVLRAISIDRDFDDYLGSCLMLETWCMIASRDGRAEQAAVLLGALSRNWQRVGSGITAFGPHLIGMHETCLGAVRAALSPERLARAVAEGARLDLHAAMSYALDAPVSVSVLSPREQEVAERVHKGLSNREIAGGLDISVRTVETHIQHIFTKLNVTSRAQIAAWYERGSAAEDT